MQAEKRHVIIADSLLLLVALVWGFGFVAQRAGMEHLGPLTFNGLRFLLGALFLLPFVLMHRARERTPNPEPTISPLAAGLAAGMVLFAGATLQQVGMVWTTAGKAGFITGLYVVFVPLFGLTAGQRTGRGTWLGCCLAAAGLYLLSIQADFTLAPGDLPVLLGAVFWAVHVLLLGRLAPRTDPLQLAMLQFFFCGLFSVAGALVLESISLRAIGGAALPVLYGGLVSVGIGYTLQVVAQRQAPPAHAAVLLSLEGVFAALGGWWLLGESLSPRSIAGCGFMLAGMLLSQLSSLQRVSRENDPEICRSAGS